MTPRRAEVVRTTRETDIRLSIDLDGQGRCAVATGVGFLDHMLELFARHAAIDLDVTCKGDIQVDAHHSTEDVGIALGQAIDRALGDRAGIRRYGWALLPMDEARASCAIDLSGRPFLAWSVPMPTPRVGDFDTELAAEFWRAVATNARATIHATLEAGTNSHHVCEAVFKGLARALRQAAEADPRAVGVPSTKGTL